MNAPSSLQRLREADPAAHLEPALTFDQLLAVARSETHVPLAGTPVPQRPVRHVGRRVALVAAAAAVATLVPVMWPSSHSPIPASTALGVDVDGAAVRVTIPLNQVVPVAKLQALLDKAHLKAKVIPATADCTERPVGLPIYDAFVVNGQNISAQQVTFYPDKIPAGTTLVFSLETSEERTDASWWITDQRVPLCAPLSILKGSADPATMAPATSR